MIFLVDDDEIQNLINSRIIENIDEKLTTKAFSNGLEALNAVKNGVVPSVIFLDINMPIMNGWDFLEEYDSEYNFPVFVITSSFNDADIQRSERYSNVKGYITKPLDQEKVQGILSQTI